MRRPIRVLLVDDEPSLLESLSRVLVRRGFAVRTSLSGADAVRRLEWERFDVVVLDRRMPGLRGERALLKIKRLRPDVEVIILTGHGSIASAVDCTKLGSFCYLEKPIEVELLAAAIEEAYCHQHDRRRHHHERFEDRFEDQFLADPS